MYSTAHTQTVRGTPQDVRERELSKAGPHTGQFNIRLRCASCRSSLVGSRWQSQHMDRAVVKLGLLLSHSGAQYVGYLECEAMHSFNPPREETDCIKRSPGRAGVRGLFRRL